jgi:hypothetical protein
MGGSDMAGNRLETFTDRHEALALFELLRRRSPQQTSWPLLPLLAYLGAGGSGKSTLIEYLIQRRCHDGKGHAFLPYAYIDFTKEVTLRDLLPILVELRDQLCRHTDEQGRRLTFPRFDLGAAIAMTALSGSALPPLHQDELREQLQQAKGVFQALKEMGNALGNALPFIPPILVALDWTGRLSRKVPVLQDVLQQLAYVSDWKWYRTQGADITVPEDASINEVILRLQALSESSRPEKEGSTHLVNRVLPAAFLADLRENLDGSYAPRTWTFSTNIVLFLDGFEALQESSTGTAKLLLDILVCNEHRLQGRTDPLLIVLGSRHRLHKLIWEEEHPSPAEQTRLQDEIQVREEACDTKLYE